MGKPRTLPLPDELAAPSLGDISPDGSRLLLRNHLATAPSRRSGSSPPPVAPRAAFPASSRMTRPGCPMASASFTPPATTFILRATTGQKAGNSRRCRAVPSGCAGRRTARACVSPCSTARRIRRRCGKSPWTGVARTCCSRTGTAPRPAECCGSWTDDGRYYVFQSARDGNSNIWAIPEHGGWFGRPAAPIPITNGPVDYQAPITERGGRRTFFIGLATQSAVLRYDAAARIFVPFASALSNARRVEFSRDKALGRVDSPGRPLAVAQPA